MKTDNAETTPEKGKSIAPETPTIDVTDVSSLTGDLPEKSDSDGTVKDLLGDLTVEPEKKKRGRPAGSTGTRKTAKEAAAHAKVAAMTVVTIQDKINQIVSAGEHIPDEKTRKEYLKLWEDWFTANPSAEPPAWLMLALATISYSAPAFASEPAKTGFAKIWQGVKTRIAKKRGLL